jgi:parallel beta-helix repeat protein
VVVAPGASIQAAVNANATGSTLCIQGLHTITSAIVPKSGDVLRGDGPGAVIDGGDVAAVAIDGNGNDVSNVTVEDLTIQHFANLDQIAAVGRNQGSGWAILNNTVAFNATEGIEAGPMSTVSGNSVHDNGQLGITGYLSDGAVVQNNEVYRNNVACAYDPSWEAGGIKLYSKGTPASVTISGNNVHDNCGPGIWVDTDISAGTISNNTVSNETSLNGEGGNGIEVELSCRLTVTGNTVTGSAKTGIMVSTSHDILVTGNTVSGGKHGIRIWAADRSADAGSICRNSSNNNTVSGNTVTSGSGVSGLYVYTGSTPTGNTFSDNTYHVSSCSTSVWQWFVSSNSNYGFTGWQGVGQDAHGSCGP